MEGGGGEVQFISVYIFISLMKASMISPSQENEVNLQHIGVD